MSVEVLTEAEANRILAWTSSQKKTSFSAYGCKRNTLMFLLMLDAGLRVGEVVKLTYDSICTGANIHTGVMIHQSTTKTKKARSIPMTKRLHIAVVQWAGLHAMTAENEPGAFVFEGTNENSHFSTRQLNRLVNKAGVEVLQKPIHPHIMRHTFATKIMLTCAMPVVQELLGHASITSTQIYTHPNSNDLVKAIAGLEA